MQEEITYHTWRIVFELVEDEMCNDPCGHKAEAQGKQWRCEALVKQIFGKSKSSIRHNVQMLEKIAKQRKLPHVYTYIVFYVGI